METLVSVVVVGEIKVEIETEVTVDKEVSVVVAVAVDVEVTVDHERSVAVAVAVEVNVENSVTLTLTFIGKQAVKLLGGQTNPSGSFFNHAGSPFGKCTGATIVQTPSCPLASGNFEQGAVRVRAVAIGGQMKFWGRKRVVDRGSGRETVQVP